MVRLIEGIPQDGGLVFDSDTNATDFLNQSIETPLAISGSAHLDVLGPIEQSAQMNATWESSISIPNTLGHPDLPNAHLGIENQIMSEFGGNNTQFFDWISSNSEIGCCAYDKIDMLAVQISRHMSTMKPGVGRWMQI